MKRVIDYQRPAATRGVGLEDILRWFAFALLAFLALVLFGLGIASAWAGHLLLASVRHDYVSWADRAQEIVASTFSAAVVFGFGWWMKPRR